MGKRGPKKTPAAIKKTRGTYRRDRDAGVTVPVPVGMPKPLVCLTEGAQSVWNMLGPKLFALKLLTEFDTIAFALLCQAFDDWRCAVADVAHSGITSVSDNGNEYQSPAVAVRNKSWEQLMRALREFGLTPSARAGLRPPGAGDGDSADDDPEVASILGI